MASSPRGRGQCQYAGRIDPVAHASEGVGSDQTVGPSKPKGRTGCHPEADIEISPRGYPLHGREDADGWEAPTDGAREKQACAPEADPTTSHAEATPNIAKEIGAGGHSPRNGRCRGNRCGERPTGRAGAIPMEIHVVIQKEADWQEGLHAKAEA